MLKDGGPPGRLRERAVSGAEVTVAAKMYSACMDVVDSDHKPVCALLSAVLPVLAPSKARKVAARLIKHVFAASAPAAPGLSVSPAALKLHQVRPQIDAELDNLVAYISGVAVQLRCHTLVALARGIALLMRRL